HEDALHLYLQWQGLGYFGQASNGVTALTARLSQTRSRPEPPPCSGLSPRARRSEPVVPPVLRSRRNAAGALRSVCPAPRFTSSRRGSGRAVARPFPQLVRGARLVAARTSAGAACEGA